MGEDNAGADVEAMSQEDAAGVAWLVVGVLVVGVVSLLLVGAFFDEPLAGRASELAIGFAWLLAATYVGFRVEGSARLRLLGAGAFVVAAVARFVSLVSSSQFLDATSLVALIVGGIVLAVLAIR